MINMRKKFLAGIVLAVMMCSAANAAGLSEYWGAAKNYASEKWNNAAGYVSGMFAKKSEDAEPQESKNNLPGAVAENWGRLTDTLSDTLALRDKQETLPKNFGCRSVKTRKPTVKR